MTDTERLAILVEALTDIRDSLESEVDVLDGQHGPIPNVAGRVTLSVERALELVGVSP